ncbi:T6SS phospholipase effector Tle1-like catalytic domain-containing protein [Paraherbaspirillum soli]|uniref:T6SS phospholipase effector Tle1-like catalytic domain-containing protein n=1 Tax=Paraherbaspirillum soli TaxID=631222 RepID=A0ABW0M8Z2_9BURK
MSAPIKTAPTNIAATAKEEAALTETQLDDLACDGHLPKPGSCDKHLKVGIFFDGTNNNRQRDKLDHLNDRSKQYHSNIVRLFEAHKDVKGQGPLQADDCYSFYVPGVGTRFPEGGEYRESQDGKAMAKGGQARILFALLQVYNAIHRAFNEGSPMFSDDQLPYQIKKYVTDVENPTFKDDEHYTRPSWFADLTGKLDQKIADKRAVLTLPKILTLDISVFGFSRGAVEARAFCYWFQDMLKGGQLAGIPASIQFLGLFDSVATVGLSHSAAETLPIPPFLADGHSAWAGEIRKPLPGCVKQCVHYIAAHEQRMNFPVTRVRGGNVVEYMYPGVHSDIGGGYGCSDQGRSMSPENLLAQVPLLHMYKAALVAKVPFVHYEKMSADLQVDFDIGPGLVKAWNNYMAAGKFDGDYDKQVKEHMRLYYGYRRDWLDRLKDSEEVADCGTQDKEDLLSYNALLKGDWELLQKRAAGKFAATDPYGHPTEKPLTDRPDKASIANYWQLHKYDQKRGPTDWEKFALDVFRSPSSGPQPLLERYVHDSLAGFWMAGYLSDEEKAEGIMELIKAGGPPKDSKYKQQVWQKYQDNPELQKIVKEKQELKKQAEQARYDGDIKRREELERQSTFTPEEQDKFARIYRDETDADAPDVRSVFITTQTYTRREGGGYFRPRYVFE